MSAQRSQMSDTLPDRQTETRINQYPCHWVKSTSSSHVLWGVCSRLLILSGRLRWPRSHCRRLFWCKSGGGTNSSSHNSIRHLHIEHLHPQKTCQCPLFLLPYFLWPLHRGAEPRDPGGSLCPRSPTTSPCLPPLSPPDPVRPGYNTWPHPRDGMSGVQGKCPLLLSPGPSAGSAARLWPTNHMHRSFFQTFSHKHDFLEPRLCLKTCPFLSLQLFIVVNSDHIQTSLPLGRLPSFSVAPTDPSVSPSGLGKCSEHFLLFFVWQSRHVSITSTHSIGNDPY